MPRVSLHTLGCKLNFAETSTIAREFSRRDYKVVPFGEPADVTVINTCTVTEQAEQKCRNMVRRAIAASPDAFVVVTGCYAQLRSEDFEKMEGVDLVLGNADKNDLFEMADGFAKTGATQVAVSCIDEVQEFGPAYSASERTRAFLKVQDGCDYGCSFCTIPAARGRSRSASLDETVAQACDIAAAGFRELVLSGVNVGLYGEPHGSSLVELLGRISEIEGMDRIRISSIEPNLLTDEIIGLVSESQSLMPHFHIPLQSGDDEILGLMRRRYRRAVYADRVERIVSSIPDACIGADVIVGFPGETDRSFANTVSFLEELPIAYLHAFAYSERPGTAALDLQHRGHMSVPKPERKRRVRALRHLSTRMRRRFSERFVGESREVLWEKSESGASMQGFTDNYIRVKSLTEAYEIGSIERVMLSEVKPDGTMMSDPLIMIGQEVR
jgi:threonylcarbamoyladenosine tRNA methylthiotransferase MtaB